MTGRVILRPSTRADFDELVDGPLPWRVRATTAEIDGKLLGVGGLAFIPGMPPGTAAAFVHATEDAKKYKVAMHRAGIKTLAEAKRLGIRRLVATAEHNNERAIPWLERLGFKKMNTEGEGVWLWHF